MRCGCTPVALFLYLTAVTPHPHTNPRLAPAYSEFSSEKNNFIMCVRANQIKHQTDLHLIAEYIFCMCQGLRSLGIDTDDVEEGNSKLTNFFNPLVLV